MRILMLGNSLTTANKLPELLADRLQADVAAHTRSGARLSEHLNPQTKLGARTQQALAEGGMDYVVMQEMSNGPVRSPARFLEAVRLLADAARHANAVPVLYATWAYAPGCPKLQKLGLSHDAMFELMHDAALQAARESGAVLADACLAFHGHPRQATLFAPDGIHPNPAGTQVACDCLAEAIANAGARDARPYFAYLLRCQDGSYYTGITTDVERRLQEHLSRGPKAARYTRTHPVAGLAATWEAADRSEASRLEYRIKRLSHAQKQALERDPGLLAGFLAPPPSP